MWLIRTTGFGLGLALTTGTVIAQQSPTSVPAARLGRIQSVEDVSARGQFPGVQPPSVAPDYTHALLPMTGSAIPSPSQSTPLGQPRAVPIPGQPIASAPPPAATFGMPVPVGIPYASPGMPVGSPVMMQPPSVSAIPAGPQPLFPPQPHLDPPLYGDGTTTGPFGLLTRPFFGGPTPGGPDRFKIDADLLMWWIRAGRIPPLVTTSSPPFNGILGQGNTQILLGDSTVTRNFHTGGRFGGVYWLDNEQRLGIDGNIFFLNSRGRDYLFNTVDNPVLARPFTNLNQNIPFSELVGSPGLAVGALAVNGSTSMWGAEGNFRRYLACTPCSRLDGFIGFRYLNLSEDLQITESFARTADSQPSIGVPTALFGSVTDRFRTENHFWGVNLGLAGEVRRGRWFSEGRAAIGLGTVFQYAQINGIQQIQFADGPSVAAGGLLAQPGANIGEFRQQRVGVLPEAGLKLGYYITPGWRVAIGYNFMYLNNVLRPGDQIDTGLDVTRIPNFPLHGDIQPLPVARPRVPFRTNDVFAQGITLSMQWTW